MLFQIYFSAGGFKWLKIGGNVKVGLTQDGPSTNVFMISNTLGGTIFHK